MSLSLHGGVLPGLGVVQPVAGSVPGAGVDVERGEDLVLESGAAGGEGDVAACGGEGDAADPCELAQCPGGGEMLVAEVGVTDVGGGEGVVDERFDDGGVDADGDVAADALF